MNLRLIAATMTGIALAAAPVFGGVAAAASAPSPQVDHSQQIGSTPSVAVAPQAVKAPAGTASRLPVKQLLVKYRSGARRAANESVPGGARVTAAQLRAGHPLA